MAREKDPIPDAWRALSRADQRAWMRAENARKAGRTPAMIEAELRLAMLVELCPHGSGPCGCKGGPPRRCDRPDRPDRVWKADCLRCVRGDGEAGPA